MLVENGLEGSEKLSLHRYHFSIQPWLYAKGHIDSDNIISETLKGRSFVYHLLVIQAQLYSESESFPLA
jgi:hypothetical protein